jgi:hypothetical protein
MLVALHLPEHDFRLVTTSVNAHNLARRSSLDAGRTREKKGGRTGET